MPTAISSSQSSAKKQQSISSFFGKSTQPKESVPLRTLDHNAAIQKQTNDDEKDLFLPADENEQVSQAIRPKSSLQRHSSSRLPDSEDEEDTDIQPQRKRQRLSDESELRQDDVHIKSPNLNTSKAAKQAQHSSQTSKYAFSSSAPDPDVESEAVDDSTKRERARMHEKFVRKLGRPDSIAEIKRRNWMIS